ncbi:ABC transporter ATP-binding protein [Nocardioides sp. CER19]|uniref:ABC transporter ATP-binding protein n=1 Tax=Nocardioides sp. CER19 TaxID=3038538 RepID=UPI0024482D72|nr:ABC transporter ATP-binding protein [Nocardioides sp. CER19]MDH2415931.1 ABC transporter ATP-binding protein [Nocardioides sp. CER19]
MTCAVESGGRVALTGPSGSGKSTLLHLMAGLDRPTSGVLDWPVWAGTPFGHPERAGVVFQEPSLIPSLTALENAAFPLLVRGEDPATALEQAAAALRILGLTLLERHTPDELSGGQAQRVAVARVICSRPALILADEPTGKLDRHNGAMVVEQLVAAADQVGAGLVIATHDPAIARFLDQRWALGDGEMVA